MWIIKKDEQEQIACTAVRFYTPVCDVTYGNIWKIKQDRQCAYTVTWRRVRATNFAVEKHECYTPERVYLQP